MLPSEVLRNKISQKYGINLEQYAWSEEFKQQVLSIELDKDLEIHANTLETIYLLGFNIGHCGLTSRYLARNFPEAKLYYGKAKILVGTESSPNGEHAWIEIDNSVIDTTLMICIPKMQAKDIGYVIEKQIASTAARVLSDYDIYEHEFQKIKKNTHN